jgi:uncharacterized membrane protein
MGKKEPGERENHMWKTWPFRNMPAGARWWFFIGVLISIVPSLMDGSAEMMRSHPPFATWQTIVTQAIAFLCWSIAFFITASTLQRRDPQPSLFMQPSLWVGLLFLTIIPDGAMLLLEDRHVLFEGLVTETVILGSLIATLFCAATAIFFWWRKRHLMVR